ncbi:MaoC/PaaZ C-terminal domain-containing protein [Cytobacillus firmus]|uniref:MaoC/PaaZ C-terminal domain-containing protein n=1 Tax=Cytobacillus firmus TaxID=1399 RepID=UPI0021635144|nr:MaoC/PaaZ C-terminal domain-containing protein [Cytobacillus firmus]MCS0671271.1 MaoC/PaaZ C-terminal domain-containing protein [Cytobacillus firmus]
MWKYYDDLKVGDHFPEILKEPISRVQLVKYAGASGDFNPLHTVEKAGEKAGTGIIAHGMLVMGMAAQGVTSWIPRMYVNSLQIRFRSMTFPGERIHVTGKVLEKKENNRIVSEVIAMNDEGEVKVSGTFEATLPSKLHIKEEKA